MPFILGDHNDLIVQHYRAEFDTEDGAIELECWAASVTDAGGACKRFFMEDHPDRVQLADSTKLQDVSPSSPEWIDHIEWWRRKPLPTGDEIMLYINPGTRVNIGGTVIAYEGCSYLIWACASQVR